MRNCALVRVCLCFFYGSGGVRFSDIQREEKNVQKAIKEAAKRNDMGSAKVKKQSL